MRKNLASLLQKGNLKPKERMLLLVHDIVKQEREGKGILSEADKHALSEGWKPKDNSEVREYNSYQEAWKTAVFAEMNALTTYLEASNGFLRASKFIGYALQKKSPLFSEKEEESTLKDSLAQRVISRILKKEEEPQALEIILNYLGQELDYLIYSYAFELADDELKQDLIALYPDAKTERGYFTQEETLYNFYKNKSELSQEEKERLTEIILDEAYNKHFKDWRFDSYFASLPLFELLGKWAFYYKQMPEKAEEFAKHLEKDKYNSESEEVRDLFNSIKKELIPRLTDYAKKEQTTVRALLKETILKWLDNGLFTKDFPPIFNSEEKATCNRKDTKLTHKEVFKKWLEVKAKAKQAIQELIDKGELKTERRERVFKNLKRFVEGVVKDEELAEADEPIKETKLIITGESLYNFKGDFTFAKDFREQAESLKLLGAIVLFLRNASFLRDYAELLGFLELFKRLSKTFDVDLTYKVKKWIKKFNDDFFLLRLEFLMLADDITEANFKENRLYYISESYLEDLFDMPANLDNIKPNMERQVAEFIKRLEGSLGTDF